MLVFFDIDGTIIDEASQIIPDSTVRALLQLKSNGHIAVVNTGRPYGHIDPRVRELSFRGYACGCGMELLLDGKWLSRDYPSRTLREKIVAVSRRYRMNSYYELADGGLMADDFSNCPDYMAPELIRMKERGYPMLTTDSCTDPQFLKLVSFIQEGSDVPGFIAALENEMEITDRGNGMFELVMRGYSKADGIRKMAEYLNIPREETLAVGDSTNDLPMLNFAGHSVCMGNGMQVVKDCCEYVTASVLDNGIEQALTHYKLI